MVEWLSIPGSIVTKGALLNIATYNLLAQGLVKRELFPYASKTALKKVTRLSRLWQQLSDLEADILCLQECDFLSDYWAPRFTGKLKYPNAKAISNQLPTLPVLVQGFAAVHDESYSLVGTMKLRSADADGCVIAWRAQKFQCLYTERVSFDQTFGPTRALGAPANVGIIAVLQQLTEPTAPLLIIGNAHLYYHPQGDYIRLAQLLYLRQACRRVAQSWMTQNPVLVFICGDFNTTPCTTAYRLLTAPRDRYDIDWAETKRQASAKPLETQCKEANMIDAEPTEKVLNLWKGMTNSTDISTTLDPLPLIRDLREAHVALPPMTSLYSQYGLLDENHALERQELYRERYQLLYPDSDAIPDLPQWEQNEPSLTHSTSNFTDTLDYIFVDPVDDRCSFETSALLKLPSRKDAAKHVAWPSDEQPSDHVPLMASIKVIN